MLHNTILLGWCAKVRLIFNTLSHCSAVTYNDSISWSLMVTAVSKSVVSTRFMTQSPSRLQVDGHNILLQYSEIPFFCLYQDTCCWIKESNALKTHRFVCWELSLSSPDTSSPVISLKIRELYFHYSALL